MTGPIFTGSNRMSYRGSRWLLMTISPESGSDGLGLSIVRAHLKSHGGDISLVSGTDNVVFRLIIPIATDSSPTSANEESN